MDKNINNFKEILTEISNNLNMVNYDGDLSDVGNEIGVIIGVYIDNNRHGFELEDFINGLKHGVSLIDGSH